MKTSTWINAPSTSAYKRGEIYTLEKTRMSVVSPLFSLPHSTININNLNDFDDKYKTAKAARTRYAVRAKQIFLYTPEFQIGNILFHRVQF